MKKNKLNKFGVRILTIAIVVLAATLGMAAKPAYAAGHWSEGTYVQSISATTTFNVKLYPAGGIGFALNNCPIIGYGQYNDSYDVEVLQIILNRYGAGLVTDGIFGDKTRNAIYNYQASHSDCYGADGYCGRNTWISLARNF